MGKSKSSLKFETQQTQRKSNHGSGVRERFRGRGESPPTEEGGILRFRGIYVYLLFFFFFFVAWLLLLLLLLRALCVWGWWFLNSIRVSRAFFVRFAAGLKEYSVRTALRLCSTIAQKCWRIPFLSMYVYLSGGSREHGRGRWTEAKEAKDRQEEEEEEETR